MTTVEPYRPPRIDLPVDAPSNPHQHHSSSTSTATNIPPSVPSPPRLSRGSPHRRHYRPPEHSSALRMALDDQSQWIFTEAEMLSTPSIRDGTSAKDERCMRAKGSNFIIQAGILLKLPQLTLATACIFFQRFYMRCSLDIHKGGIHHYTIAGTALFLATKTEENCRKTKEVVIACAKVAQKNSNLVIDEQSKEYWRWRDNILQLEEQMLEFLTFDLIVESPHNHLYALLHRLHIEEHKRLRNSAWAFVNDACHTSLCVQLPAPDIAIAAVYFALGINNETLPDDENGTPWWERVGGKPEKIVRGVAVMHEFFTENPLLKSDSPYDESPKSYGNEEDLQRSRRRADVGSNENTPSPGQSQSQPMQNGHSQQSQASTAPIVNGNGAAALEATGNGSSDAILKAVANDPTTHEANGDTNGAAADIPKRKNSNDEDLPPSKRPKNSMDADKNLPPGEGNGVAGSSKPAAEESEEGELEE